MLRTDLTFWRFPLGLLLTLIGLLGNHAAFAEDWPQWRGLVGDNRAPAATAPIEWSETEGLAWKTPVPGKGHSSPILVGPRIYLTTADDAAETQSLLIYDRATGKKLVEKVVHRGGLTTKVHPNNTNASPTVACDGEHIYTLFDNEHAAWVTAFSLEGKQLWQVRALGFDPQQYQFGFGSSPRIVGDTVVVSSEYDGSESGIVALDTTTGKVRWRTPRPQGLSYSTPIEVALSDSPQLLLSGNNQIVSYDAKTGEKQWSKSGSTRATCGTMVWDKQLGYAFASGGYPDSFTLAIDVAGDQSIVWQKRVKCYEQSMLSHDGYIYAVTDRAVAYCWRAKDGEEMWKQRLEGRYSSSPLLVGNKIYVTNENGTIYVFEATPEKYIELAENQLGNYGFATPAPADGRLYYRYARDEGGKRQEYLVAVGE